MMMKPVDRILRDAVKARGLVLDDLSVLSSQKDPFRIGTKAHHRAAEWFARHFEDLLPPTRVIHLRGFHYALVAKGDIVKPDGKPYKNVDGDWTWMSELAAKWARYLGYIPFERIKDERNAPPAMYAKGTNTVGHGEAYVRLGGKLELMLPDKYDLKPQIYLERFEAAQPYHLAI